MQQTTYEALHSQWLWDLSPSLNIATACADDQPPERLALVDVPPSGEARHVTFGDLAAASRRLASGLAGLGVGAGDRVGVVLPQRLETALTHLASYRLGAIAVPMSSLFGPEALRFRIADSGMRVVVTDAACLDTVADVAAELGDVRVVVVDAVARSPHATFADLLAGRETTEVARTGPDTPALLIYTSGTTGPPKGALHGHRVLVGHLPGYELMFDRFPQAADRVWTPADWAWIGGLLDALLPAWWHGVPVVATRRQGGFDPEWATAVLRDHEVTAAFLPPTALKLLRQADASTDGHALRTVMSGGETLGAALLDWGQDRFGLTINEIYGQTEANLVVGNCASVWDVRPGSMGRPYPGHRVAVLDDDGRPAAPGVEGQVAVEAPDPVMFLEYWGQPDATRAKFAGDWLLTGDMGRVDDDGYLWFAARSDDVIISAGYRIGPAEIEECLIGHRSVALAAAVGVPDETRGEVVKAFVQLVDGVAPTEALEAELVGLVRRQLAAYEYPRQLEFVDELPLTTTGKLRRKDLRDREGERMRS